MMILNISLEFFDESNRPPRVPKWRNILRRGGMMITVSRCQSSLVYT